MNNLFVIIPARSGSVGVPDKNIAEIGGQPLLVRAYRAASNLQCVKQVIVSTDSARYLEILKTESYADPSLRPTELSTSNSLVIDTIIYELARVDASDNDLVAVLEPSFVGKRIANLQLAIENVRNGSVDSCFGAYRVPIAFHHAKQYVNEGGLAKSVGRELNINRQQLSPAFVRSGEFYLSRVSNVRAERSLFGGRLKMFETSQPFVNIDSAEDMKQAIMIANLVVE